MSDALTWDRFVVRGLELATLLAEGVRDLVVEQDRARMLELRRAALAIADPALQLGADAVGRLARACELCLDHMVEGRLDVAHALPLLASSCETLRAVVAELAEGSTSSSRLAGTPLEAATYELETLFPLPGAPAGGAPDVPLTALRRGRNPAPSAPESPGVGAPRADEKRKP